MTRNRAQHASLVEEPVPCQSWKDPFERMFLEAKYMLSH